MRVAVYYNNNDIRLEERPRPKINEGEILVKVMASAICGTDVMEWYRIKKAPCVLGHEIAGEIVESRSDKFKVGQRVFATHHVPCNKCRHCLEGNHTACETLHNGNFEPGGFSEYIRVPKINVENGTYALPENVSYEEGTFIEPLACVVRGQRVIGVKQGQTILILGSGVSGILNIQAAKQLGAAVIATDIDGYRLKKAKEFGADSVIDARDELDIKADKVIVCTGAYSAVEQAFKCIDRKGTILFFAIPSRNIEIPNADFWRNEISVVSSYGAAPGDLEESLELIRSKKIDVKDMVTHRLPFKKIGEGFRMVADPKESLKVIIEPQK